MNDPAATMRTVVRLRPQSARSVSVPLAGRAAVLDLTGLRDARAATPASRTAPGSARAA